MMSNQDSQDHKNRPVNESLDWKPGITLREAWLQASSFLHACSIGQDARRVAEWLLLDLLQMERGDWFMRWHEPFPAERWADWKQLLERKAAGEPVQYIIGEQEFMGMSFAVGPNVLIPRPETEVLVEAALHAGDELENQPGRRAPNLSRQPLTVADIGTGSGAIAVSLAKLRPAWRFVAIDMSRQALDTAKQNAARHGVEDRIRWVQGDLAEPLLIGKVTDHTGDSRPGVCVDMLLSNPPYIPTSDMTGLPREVRVYEPALALDGGQDGLDAYRRMLSQMLSMAEPPRIVGWECGDGQAAELERLLRSSGLWSDVRIIDDLSGKQRHVFAM